MINFYQTLSKIHGYWAIVVIILGLISLIWSFILYFKKENIPFYFRKTTFYTTMSFHIQVLLGLIMIFINSGLFSDLGFKIGGKVSFIEHLSSGLLAVLFITIFNSKVKKSSHVSLSILIFIILSILFITRAIPLAINVILN